MKQKGLTCRQAGFSLLELLVVISIIGLLLAIAVVGFTAAQQRTRDARRRGDLKSWQDALEQTFAQYTDYQGAGSSTTCQDSVTDHMNGIAPTDPKNSGSYVYTASCPAGGASYCICSYLENVGGGNSDTAACTFTGVGSKDYFCVNNLQ